MYLALRKIGTGLIVVACIAPMYKIMRKMFHNSVPTLYEVHLTNVLSACCSGIRKPTCTNKYCKVLKEERLVELITSAKHTILLSMYIFTSIRLAQAIISAHQRGVRVLVIGCRSMAHSTGSQMNEMRKLDIAVRFPLDSDTLVHHKFCLIDTTAPPTSEPRKAVKPLPDAIQLPSNGVLISGSMNWTMQALSGNWDNFIVTSEPKLVQPFVEEFIMMWARFHPEEQGRRRGDMFLAKA